MLPFKIDGDLTIRIGGSAVQLTPSQGLQAAERLIRKSTRRMMLEEAFDTLPPEPRVPNRSRSAN
jgi:hypothetical protein